MESHSPWPGTMLPVQLRPVEFWTKSTNNHKMEVLIMMCILLTALVLAATAASHLANPVNIYSTKSEYDYRWNPETFVYSFPVNWRYWLWCAFFWPLWRLPQCLHPTLQTPWLFLHQRPSMTTGDTYSIQPGPAFQLALVFYTKILRTQPRRIAPLSRITEYCGKNFTVFPIHAIIILPPVLP